MPRPVQDDGSLVPKKFKCGHPALMTITGDYLDDTTQVELSSSTRGIRWDSPAIIRGKARKELKFQSTCHCNAKDHDKYEDGDVQVTVTNLSGSTPKTYPVTYTP